MRLLLVMPEFMGYEKDLINSLSSKYEIAYLDSECKGKLARDIFKPTFTKKVLHKLIKFIDTSDRCKAVKMACNDLINDYDILKQTYDIVLVINGHYISNDVYVYLKNNNPNAQFMLYLWDDADNLFRRDFFGFFDKKFSYNIDDCKKYSMKYLPMFVRTNRLEHLTNKYDISFIASVYPDRVAIAKKLYEQYHEKLKMFIYLYENPVENDFFCYNKPLLYDEYISILRESRCVLEIPYYLQQGPTTRAFDALQTGTKLITTNKQIKRYPIYSNNVAFLDRDNPKLDLNFIKSPYEETNKEALEITKWLDYLGL